MPQAYKVPTLFACRGDIGRDGLRLGKIVYAPTPEASRTASLLVRRIRGEGGKANEDLPDQPDEALGSDRIEVAAPPWLPEPDRLQRIGAGACGYQVPYEPWDELLPNRLYQRTWEAARSIDEEVEGLRDGSNALLVVGHQPQSGVAPLSTLLANSHW